MSFFGKTFWWSLLLLLAWWWLSFFGFEYPPLGQAMFWTVTCATLILAFWRIDMATLLVLAELIVGVNGRMFTVSIHGETVPVRMALFGAIMLAWLFHVLRRKTIFPPARSRLARWYFAIAGAVVWGMVMAFAYRRDLGDIFFDANGYWFFALAFPLTEALRSVSFRRRALQLLAAASIAVSLESLFVLGLFSHGFSGLFELYRWLRDTRQYEINALGYSFYRVFTQAQVFQLFAFFVFSFAAQRRLWGRRAQWGLLVVVFASLLGILISFSRSFWLAFAVCAAVWCVLHMKLLRRSWKELFRAAGVLAGMAGAALLLISFTVNAPYVFYRPGSQPTLLSFAQRTDSEEAALLSRYDLLGPLLRADLRHPFLGSGFGTTVTFRSHDPRIVGQGGEQTTFAFEWGYLDMWLKLGLFGTAIVIGALVFVLRNTLREALRAPPTEQALLAGFFLALLSIALTHGISPYLNHPLGIGALLLTAGFTFGIRGSYD